ncbi:hypothetical protein [Mycobacterium sp. JS623]|uniref:hypothetical protein n=1 Tax=Mycobacterium sp. JS623 TaxID=212767 RepID=UPI00059E2917|nr:hypothetical protein [Mycobacterium sp. JS623]
MGSHIQDVLTSRFGIITDGGRRQDLEDVCPFGGVDDCATVFYIEQDSFEPGLVEVAPDRLRCGLVGNAAAADEVEGFVDGGHVVDSGCFK